MSDGPKSAVFRGDAASACGRIDTLPVAEIPAGRGRSGQDVPDEGFLRRLEMAVLGTDRDAQRAVLSAMMRAGISWAEVSDTYIPAVARRLGEAWCEDTLGFAEVTIGSARLQGMLREFGPEWSEEVRSDPLAPNVLLIMPRQDNHTLGAMVVAGQMRRARISVRLSLGEHDEVVMDHVATKRFDAVLISASGSVRLETVRDLVKKIRMAARPVPPLVLGGTILDTDRDAKTITDVDHATCDLQKVMSLCGIRTPFRATATSGKGVPRRSATSPRLEGAG
jgi:methylmalonyl-CoA mutase cobalamin-binding subunit